MRKPIIFGLLSVIAGALVVPVAAQDSSGEAPTVNYRSLMPLQVDIEKFVSVGSGEFGAGIGETKSIHGWSDHNFDTIAMMPLDNLAVCVDLTVTYASGDEEHLLLIRPGLLSHKQIYEVLLRGEPNDVSVIDANCHSVSGGGVTIGFYGATGDLF